MKTIQLKLKEPIEKATFGLTDLYLRIYNSSYCSTYNKFCGFNTMYIERDDNIRFALSSSNKSNFNDLSDYHIIEDKRILISDDGRPIDYYPQYLYIITTEGNDIGYITIKDGINKLTQIGSMDSWGSGLISIDINSSDIVYSNINSLSVHQIIIDDKPLSGNFVGLICNYFNANNKKEITNDITVQFSLYMPKVLNNSYNTLIPIYIAPLSHLTFVNYQINHYIRLKTKEDYAFTNRINIYGSELIFDTVDDVNRFVTGTTGSINLAKDINIYPKPTVDTTAFLSLNITEYTISFLDR